MRDTKLSSYKFKIKKKLKDRIKFVKFESKSRGLSSHEWKKNLTMPRNKNGNSSFLHYWRLFSAFMNLFHCGEPRRENKETENEALVINDAGESFKTNTCPMCVTLFIASPLLKFCTFFCAAVSFNAEPFLLLFISSFIFRFAVCAKKLMLLFAPRHEICLKKKKKKKLFQSSTPTHHQIRMNYC